MASAMPRTSEDSSRSFPRQAPEPLSAIRGVSSSSGPTRAASTQSGCKGASTGSTAQDKADNGSPRARLSEPSTGSRISRSRPISRGSASSDWTISGTAAAFRQATAASLAARSKTLTSSPLGLVARCCRGRPSRARSAPGSGARAAAPPTARPQSGLCCHRPDHCWQPDRRG